MPLFRQITMVGWGLLGAVLCAGLAAAPSVRAADADLQELYRQAARAQSPEEALTPLQQAVELAPEQPAAHLDYGSTLFKVGQRTLEAGEEARGIALFRDAEHEFLSVLRLAEHETDPTTRRRLKSQAAFLLGDAYFFVFKNKQRAKQYYQEALWCDPQHPGALRARQQFDGE